MRRLLIRPGAIGDCILSLPALEHLRVEYTEVWAPTNVLPLIRFANRVRSIVSTGLDSAHFPESLVAELRSFDSVISWYGSNRPDFVTAIAQLGPDVRFFPALPPDGERVHATDFFSRQVGGPPGQVPSLPLAIDNCDTTGLGVIHPFSGGARKNWPLERYQELARSLTVKFCAGPEEALPGAVHIDDLYDLASWLSRASYYVGNDSGITHLAAAAGTPVVALFGPTDPAVWAPRGERVVIVKSGDTMENISVQEVLNAIRQIH